MALTDGRLETDDADAILDALMADAKEYFGPDLNDDERAAIRLFYRPLSERLAESQQDIKLVLDSAQLDYADGQALDLLTGLIGVRRNPARFASGTAIFSRDTRTHQTYTISKGTAVQTDANDPVVFETTASRTMPLLADFESGSLPQDYSGDTASATVQSTTVLEGTYTLELDATSGAEVYNDSLTTRAGMTLHYYTQCSTGSIPIFTFGKVDGSNYYQVVIDHNSDRVAIEKVEDGTAPVTVAEDTAPGVPAGERLDVELDWSLSGDITVTVWDSTDTEVTSFSGEDSTYTEGYMGFKSGDANGAKWFDYATTSEVPAPVECTDAGPNGNAGRNTLVIMPDPPTGIEAVTNTEPTTGGARKETDRELRERAQSELSEGTRASASALVSKTLSVDGVTSVSIFTIDSDGDGTDDGFELVIEGGSDEAVAQAILDTMAAGDTSHSGINGNAATGTAELPNGQQMTIDFSRPQEITIYVDADLTVEDTFAGKDAVRDSIVDYIGGQYSSGNDASGLGSGDDVIWTEVMFAIQRVEVVYDVQNLYVDTASGGTNQSNISIADNEVATADGTDDSMTFTVTEQ